ncbi:methyl-coenzyme M reductase [Acinetobacter haemolyticus]|uniref:methyl-coenzyme M reductase n=1 Tax=Acinetobacter haemolyticus TaxID=29430 RepID=UPI0024DE74DF|nr:methyl-coenzyme M reductase [Acinetobacter haemolyticus]
MKIPVSRGRVEPQAQMQTFTPNTGLSDIGRAVGGAVQARDEQQREQEVTAKRLELYHNDLDEKEGRIKVDDFLTTSFAEKATLLRNDVANGVKNSQQASEELKSWTDGEFKSLSESLPMHAQHTYKQYVDSTVGKQGAGFLPLQLKADEQKNISLLDRAFSIATRLPREKRHEYLGSYLAGANIPEVQKTEYLRNLDITSDKMDIDSRMLNAVDNSDINGLKTLSSELSQGNFSALDGQTAQNYQKSIASKIASLEQKQQVMEQKRVNEAGKVLNSFKQSVLTGRDLDPDYIQNVRTAVSGTEHQADFDFYIQHSKNFQDFAKLDTSEQLKRINQQKANMKNTSSADPEAENKLLSTYESIYQDKLKTLKDDPNQALREKGIELPEINPLQLKLNPNQFASNLIEIGTYQVSMKDKDANATIKPISPEDLPEAAKAFDELDVNGKLSFIGSLINQSKGVKDGTKIWEAALGQLGSGDMNYVMAGVAKANNYHTTEGRDLATSIITGTQLLKNKQLFMPKEDDLRAAFNDYVGQTLTGTSANNAYETFKAVYADTMVARGLSHADSKAMPDKSVLKTALQMATGGVYTQPSKYTNYMGEKGKDWKVTKPYGMDDDAFESRLDQGYSVISKQTGISTSDLKGLRLRQLRQGTPSNTGEIQYDLINERGQPLIVNDAVWRIKMSGVTK